MPVPLRILVTLTLLATCACHAPLTEPAWHVTDRGSLGAIGRLGVYADYEAQSDFAFDSNLGSVEASLTSELIGKFGGVVGLEWFVAKDVSLLVGVDHRVFDPEESEGFLLDTVSSTEYFLAARWILPPMWGAGDRWRAFVEGKFGYVPSTTFDTEIDFQAQGATIPNPAFEFDGSAWTNVGLSTGLLYQLTDDIVAQFSVIYEWPLESSQDTVEVEIPTTPLVLDLQTDVEPEGLIALIGITFYF